MKEKLYIVKIGGNVIDHEASLEDFLQVFSQIPDKKILVHGGGKVASQFGLQLGIEPQYLEGRRITDDQTIDLVTMVYGGLINKKLVAQLNALDTPALGLTGADGRTITAHRRPVTNGVDYGWVGDIDRVNSELLSKLIKEGQTPVLAPLTADNDGHLLNTNADTIASAVAGALSTTYEAHLIYCFEKPGVLRDVNDDASIISEMDHQSISEMRKEGIIHDGMIPKLTNALAALDHGAMEVVVGHSGMLRELVTENFKGCTRITR